MLSSAEAEAAVDTLNETTSNTAGPPPDAAAASFPEPYNTTGDTVTRGAFAALVDPYKRSIGIDPSEPPGNVFLYVSRFVSSANRRVAWHAFTPADTAGFTCQDYRNHRPIALDPHAFAAYVGTVLNATRRREEGGGGYDESASET